MTRLKILSTVVAFAFVVGTVTDSIAQCAPGRLFRSSGKLGSNIDFDVTGTDNNGNQIGYFWDSDDADNSNSGFAPNHGSRCPIDQWWKERVPPYKQIDGVQGAVGCHGAGMGCPDDKMTLVVEDYAAGGPPGIGLTAYYAAFMVDETPASGRWYDYGALDMLPGNSVIPMLPFPDVVVTGIQLSQGARTVSYTLLDQSQMVHSTDWAGGGGTFPTDAVIREWQLYHWVGDSDPGRARSNGWVKIRTIPYLPGGASDIVSIPLPAPWESDFLAMGIGFNGGAHGVIDSALVGRAIDLGPPILANPEWPEELDPKPKATQAEPKSRRSEGRR